MLVLALEGGVRWMKEMMKMIDYLSIFLDFLLRFSFFFSIFFFGIDPLE